MDELKEECEDVMFELSDRRERYPDKCATEFAETVRMQSNMSALPIECTSPKAKKFSPLMSESQRKALDLLDIGDPVANPSALTDQELKQTVDNLKKSQLILAIKSANANKGRDVGSNE